MSENIYIGFNLKLSPQEIELLKRSTNKNKSEEFVKVFCGAKDDFKSRPSAIELQHAEIGIPDLVTDLLNPVHQGE